MKLSTPQSIRPIGRFPFRSKKKKKEKEKKKKKKVKEEVK